MKYIIMCGGIYRKWEQPRQLIEIFGEPIVARTIRLLREAGVEDIAISSNNDIFEQFGVPVLRHENSYNTIAYNVSKGFWCDCFYPTDEPACYMYGDVVYSPEAIKIIVREEVTDIKFFGSCPPYSRMCIKKWPEPFAFKVANQEHLHQAVADVKRLYSEGKFTQQPISWEMWNVISLGPDGDINTRTNFNYIHINDYTCDIDKPSDVALLEKMVKYVK